MKERRHPQLRACTASVSLTLWGQQGQFCEHIPHLLFCEDCVDNSQSGAFR